ncbi:glycosyltransferase family 2 protein [Soonwooa purpurea]
MQNTNPKVVVSICSITFNHAPYIRECLDGFLMQQCDFEFEVLIHDDASTDGTQEIIKEYQEKYPDIIKSILQTENQWSQGIRNIQSRYNFSRAKGKYIAMCEGDDYWTDPLKLQKQVDFLEKNGDFVLTFHKAKIKDINSGKYKEDYLTKVPERYDSPEVFAMKGNYIHTPSILFRNIIVNLNMKYNCSQIGDFFLLLHLVQFGKIGYIEKSMCVYRVGSGFFSKSSGISKEIELLKCIISAINSLQNQKIINVLISREKLLSDYLKFSNQKLEKKSITLSLKKWIKKFLR